MYIHCSFGWIQRIWPISIIFCFRSLSSHGPGAASYVCTKRFISFWNIYYTCQCLWLRNPKLFTSVLSTQCSYYIHSHYPCFYFIVISILYVASVEAALSCVPHSFPITLSGALVHLPFFTCIYIVRNATPATPLMRQNQYLRTIQHIALHSFLRYIVSFWPLIYQYYNCCHSLCFCFHHECNVMCAWLV
jgi:hypothetical protein